MVWFGFPGNQTVVEGVATTFRSCPTTRDPLMWFLSLRKISIFRRRLGVFDQGLRNIRSFLNPSFLTHSFLSKDRKRNRPTRSRFLTNHKNPGTPKEPRSKTVPVRLVLVPVHSRTAPATLVLPSSAIMVDQTESSTVPRPGSTVVHQDSPTGPRVHSTMGHPESSMMDRQTGLVFLPNSTADRPPED